MKVASASRTGATARANEDPFREVALSPDDLHEQVDAVPGLVDREAGAAAAGGAHGGQQLQQDGGGVGLCLRLDRPHDVAGDAVVGRLRERFRPARSRRLPRAAAGQRSLRAGPGRLTDGSCWPPERDGDRLLPIVVARSPTCRGTDPTGETARRYGSASPAVQKAKWAHSAKSASLCDGYPDRVAAPQPLDVGAVPGRAHAPEQLAVVETDSCRS